MHQGQPSEHIHEAVGSMPNIFVGVQVALRVDLLGYEQHAEHVALVVGVEVLEQRAYLLDGRCGQRLGTFGPVVPDLAALVGEDVAREEAPLLGGEPADAHEILDHRRHTLGVTGNQRLRAEQLEADAPYQLVSCE